MPWRTYKNGKWERFEFDVSESTPVEERTTPSTKITIDYIWLPFMFVLGLAIGTVLDEMKYRDKIANAELIPYETLMKKGLAKPVKDENGDLKLKLMECE